MIFYDTETCGFHGPIVLLQYAVDDGPIQLIDVWKITVGEVLEHIKFIIDHPGGVCGFNLAFDHFHLCQMYTTCLLLDPDSVMEDIIDEYALNEPEARFGPCLKPKHCLDLMLHARKGPYQSTMNRKDVRIRRVPTQLAWALADELTARIPLKDIYFERKKDCKQRWTVVDLTDEDGDPITGFKDLVLKFAPSSALKALAKDALGIDTDSIKLFTDIEPPIKSRPEELGYAPFAMAIGRPGNWNGAWPDYGKITVHIAHWFYNRHARKYAADDIVYTRGLYKFFGCPPVDDDDSILSCLVGAVRWHGYRIDVPGLKKLRAAALDKVKGFHFNFRSVPKVRMYIAEHMSEIERSVITIDNKLSTKAPILEEVARWTIDTICESCQGMSCKLCDEGLLKGDEQHPAAVRAAKILYVRRAAKEVELFDKLIKAGRFHASFRVIGTKSTRMSGADGLNAQGIKHDRAVRECFPLWDPGYSLTAGDFSGFEIVLMDAAYGDPILRAEIESGKKIHAIAGTFFFPPMTYEEILATKGLPNEQDKYDRAKKGVYAMAYGGESYTLQTRVGIEAKHADEAYANWCKKYLVWASERRKDFDAFCSMRQPGGLGSRVEWHEPQDYIESMFGFKRYFTLENSICRALFLMAENPPKAWSRFKIKVVRRDREQTASGALRSSLFGAAFQIQASNMRAASNHRIQSTGAQLNKILQCRIWTLQPTGIHEWVVIPMNVHDEIQSPALPVAVPKVRAIVEGFVEEYRETIPLLEIDWGEDLASWAEK